MNKIILLSLGLLFSLSVRAQLYSATPNQTQHLRDATSVELGPGFSSSAEVSITIDTPLNAFGQWATVPNWGEFIGIHTSVLPNGSVLSWQGHNDDHMTSLYMGTGFYLWNTSKAKPSQPDLQLDRTNAFCTGHSFLADGKLLVTGGHHGTVQHLDVTTGKMVDWYIEGLPDANTYDYTITTPATTTNPAPGWNKEEEMIRNRWYPTNTTLSSGAVLTTAGETEPDPIVLDSEHYPEVFQNGNWFTLTGASKILPTYPWMFQAPNGHAFYAGPGTDISYLNPNGLGTWTTMNAPPQPRAYDFRGQGTAAMFWPGRILLAGGSDGQTVTNTAEVIELGSATTVAGGYQQPAITPAPGHCRSAAQKRLRRLPNEPARPTAAGGVGYWTSRAKAGRRGNAGPTGIPPFFVQWSGGDAVGKPE